MTELSGEEGLSGPMGKEILIASRSPNQTTVNRKPLLLVNDQIALLKNAIIAWWVVTGLTSSSP